MIMETPILTTQNQTLPSMKVQLVVEVYSDEPLRYPQAFFRGVTRPHTSQWTIVQEYEQGIKMVSEPRRLQSHQSLDEVFSDLNPGFYHTNCKISYQVV